MKKILIIRFSSIGDIVLTSPVIRCLKQQLDGAEIHYATKPEYKTLLEKNPYLGKIFLLSGRIKNLAAGLKNENYDAVIDLHHNLRSFILKNHLGKKSYSFPKRNIEKWLLVNVHIDRMPGEHIVDRYFKAVEKLGVKNDGNGLDYFIPENEAVNIREFFHGIDNNRFVAFAIGGKFNTKKLPVNKIISICDKISLPVILLGGAEDADVAKLIVERSKSRIYNACGKLSLNQSASVIQQSLKVITHDTGMMHIAAAFNKEIVTLWGNTVPKFGMYAYTKSKVLNAEVQGLSCRPCSKLGFSECPKGHFRCMNDIDELAVSQFINS